MLKSTGREKDIFICLVLTLFIIIIYGQAQGFKFTYYDDSSYVTERAYVMAGLTLDGLKWAMTATEAGFWHPLTWLSLMLDREMFGNYAGGYHLTNVFLHIINTLILFFILRTATRKIWPSALVAILFAVHPLHAESVAWMSQRKDLLCTLFGFAALLAYVLYAGLPNWRRYSLVIVFFILGLMAKPMIVTFPFVMLLLDYWPLQRFRRRGEGGKNPVPAPESPYASRSCCFLLLEKVPLLVLSVLASVLVVVTEQKAHALTDLKTLPIIDRLANAIVSYVKYIGMMFWPTDLTFFYPHPVNIPPLQVVGALLLLAAITIVVVLSARHRPYLFTGWFWYAGMLLPVSGLIQVGPHALADRYTYVPLTGLFIIIVWLAADFVERHPKGKPLLWVLAAAVIISLSCCAWRQAGYWKNSVTLFEQALKINPENYIALSNLGQFYIDTGERDKGLAYMYKAIQVKPKFGPLYYNVGLSFYGQRKYQQALEYFARAEETSFKNDENRRMLADCYRLTGKWPQAVSIYRKSLELNSRNTAARYGLSLTLRGMGRNEEAIRELRATLAGDPRHLNARKILMLLALEKGDMATVVLQGRQAEDNGSADGEVRKMIELASGKKASPDRTIAFPEGRGGQSRQPLPAN